MSDFPGPFDPPELDVPLPPPEVGFGSPWAPADGENRDRILDWWRMWWRRVFFPWLSAFLAALNAWLEAAEAYIIAHAISGYSWRTTATVLDPVVGHTTAATFTGVDQAFRPLVVGDLVADETAAKTYGEITAVIDATHATVTTLGKLSGLDGHSWWTTTTPISATGTTDVTLTAEAGRLPQVGDFVSDQTSALRYGEVTALIDATHVTVAPLGVLRGLAGFGWWVTATTIAHTGTTDVVLSSGPDRLPQINDLVVDETPSSAYGEIIAVGDATHVTVAYVNTLEGPAGVADLGAFDFTTPTLASEGVYQGQMAAQPQMVGAFTVTVDHPAWVRVYASQAYMLADASRDILTPLNIAADHGCYLDFVGVLSELSKTLTPGVQITDLGDGVWLSVTNTDLADPQDIRVHLDYRIFRE